MRLMISQLIEQHVVVRARAWLTVLLVMVSMMQPQTARAQAGVSGNSVSEIEVEKDIEKPWNRGISREKRIAARNIFLEGNRLLKVPLFAQAAQKYQEALQLWQHPAIYYNLAIAQLNLVQPVEAYQSLEWAMAHGPEPLFSEERYKQAAEYRARLKEQLSVIEVSCEEAGAEVLLDGELLFTAPGSAEEIVLPGSHLLVARKAGLIPETKQVVASAGDRVAFSLVLWADVVETKRYMPAWIPWVVMGAGGLFAAGAGYVDWASSQDIEDSDAQFAEECGFGCLDSERQDLASSIRSAEQRKYVALGLYAVGGAAFLTGAVLGYVNRERVVRYEDRDEAIAIVPLLLPKGAGVGAMVRFE